jgi:hypothetical protein
MARCFGSEPFSCKEAEMKIILWQRIRAWFKDSETIFLARLQMLVGILWSVLPTIDPTLFQSLVGERWFGMFLIVWGVITEIARRRRAKDL